MARFLVITLYVAAAAAQTKTMFPPVRGTREMVGAANNFEVEAGYRILVSGGNAVDAGVASVLAAAVTEQSRFGLGGEMPLIVKMSGRPPVVISGVGVAPALATVDYYKSRNAERWEDPAGKPPIPEFGVLAAITPGVFDGLLLALSEYGTMPFAEVAAPAIGYAKGFPLGEEFASFIRDTRPMLDLWPASQAFFLPNHALPPRGAIFRQPALEKTLQELAAVERKARGKRTQKIQAVRDHFYRGPIARRLAEFSEQAGGLIRFDDLKNYHAEIDQPARVMYRGYEIVKPGFWTQGPVLLQALNLLESYDLKTLGHYSPEYLHTVVEAVKLAFADRDRYYGDPKHSKIPADRLLSKDYAAERRRQIDPAHASLDHRPGAFGGPIDLASASSGTSQASDTTCVNVVDSKGNVFSATPSGAWLPSVIAGDTGIPLSTRLQSFVLTAGHANQLAPGKRPRVTLSPTLVLRDGQPILAMSTPGGDNQDQALLQVLLNVLDFQMSPQEAVEAPRFQSEHFYSSFAHHDFQPGKLNLEARIPRATADRLRARGHRVTVTGEWSNGSAPTLIVMRGGVLDGGADPRRGRFIFGR
ncbi:MAG: gamma-glutamyltransferase family protein [Bryobacteraceae bacterium]